MLQILEGVISSLPLPQLILIIFLAMIGYLTIMGYKFIANWGTYSRTWKHVKIISFIVSALVFGLWSFSHGGIGGAILGAIIGASIIFPLLIGVYFFITEFIPLIIGEFWLYILIFIIGIGIIYGIVSLWGVGI